MTCPRIVSLGAASAETHLSAENAPPSGRPLTHAGADAAGLTASLAAIGRALREAFDPHGFLEELSAHLEAMLPHDRLLIAHLEDEGRTFTVFGEHARVGPRLHEGPYTLAFDPGGRYTPHDWDLWSVFGGKAISGGKDFQGESRSAGVAPTRFGPGETGFRSHLAVPLHSGGRAIGALLAARCTPDIYTEGQVATARQVADQLGPVIEHIVLLHRERRRRRRLEALAGLPRVFGMSLNVKDIFDRLAEAVRPALDFDAMGAVLFRPAARDVELLGRAVEDPSRPILAPLSPNHYSFAARLEAGDAVLHRDIRLELDPARAGDRVLIERGIRSTVCVPLRFREEVGGALAFLKWKPNWYEQSDVEIATGIGAQVVLAVQHQRLAEEQRRLAVAEERAHKLEQRVAALRDELGERYGLDQILGRSPALREALARAEKVAPTETTVMLTGESGTGKELVARAIHYASPRSEGPFLALNCAALPETLLESELFGHERGAFTGAERQTAGRFELAAGGTLFLDEVGELSPGVQVKLLRVIEEREYQRVGGTATLRADARIITATNHDLERAAATGHFRQDLFYRLNVFRVHMPPLRERRDDILPLAEHFVGELAPKLGKGNAWLSREAREALLAHAWPGNIRELRNAVERALIMSEGGLLTAAQLGIEPESHPASHIASHDKPADVPAAESWEAVLEMERRMVLNALAKTHGNKQRAARMLGLTRSQIYTRLKRLGIRP